MVLGAMGGHKAIIRMEGDKTLRVQVVSEKGRPTSEFFPLIRNEILNVNRALGLSAREAIAKGGDVFTVKNLLNTYKRGDGKVFGDKSDEEYSAYELLNQFYDAPMITGMEVNKEGQVRIQPYSYHKCSKSDQDLRNALFDVYGEKCFYTKKKIEFEDMQVDHILAKKYIKPDDNETKMYLARLAAMGFDLDDPDYIENYLPCRGSVNRDWSNNPRPVETLMFYHEKALENTPKVLKKMEYYKNLKNNRGK
jgi:hypothetical protein